MRKEYNSVLLTPTEADKIGCFGWYRYIGETQISARYIGLSPINRNRKNWYCFGRSWAWNCYWNNWYI